MIIAQNFSSKSNYSFNPDVKEGPRPELEENDDKGPTDLKELVRKDANV